MPTNHQLARVLRDLSQSPIKLQGVFKATHFDRLLKKQLEQTRNNGIQLKTNAEGMIRSGIIAQLVKPRSQRDFVEMLTPNIQLRVVSKFGKDVPVQSTFSRHWNDSNYHDVLDELFVTYRKLVAQKKIPYEFEASNALMRTISEGYYPVIVDATFIPLSPLRFNFASRGYAGRKKRATPGAKINLMVDGLANFPLNYVPTEGKKHETKTIDLLHDEFLTANHSWLRDLTGRPLRVLSIVDKGYWKKRRFWNWLKNGKYFICPRKKKSLTGVQFEFLEFPTKSERPVEALVWDPDETEPIRWIVARNRVRDANTDRFWDLLTSDLRLPASVVIDVYRERWPIEELFKWLKQYTTLCHPLVDSWDGFVIHCYLAVLLLMILQFFLGLLGVPRWQENLTELWRQIRHAPEKPWNFGRLRIPLALLKEVMT